MPFLVTFTRPLILSKNAADDSFQLPENKTKTLNYNVEQFSGAAVPASATTSTGAVATTTNNGPSCVLGGGDYIQVPAMQIPQYFNLPRIYTHAPWDGIDL